MSLGTGLEAMVNILARRSATEPNRLAFAFIQPADDGRAHHLSQLGNQCRRIAAMLSRF